MEVMSDVKDDMDQCASSGVLLFSSCMNHSLTFQQQLFTALAAGLTWNSWVLTDRLSCQHLLTIQAPIGTRYAFMQLASVVRLVG